MTEPAESRVRAVWELVHVCDGVERYRGIMPYPAGTVLIQRGACGEWHEFPSMVEALAFTEERVEEVRQAEMVRLYMLDPEINGDLPQGVIEYIVTMLDERLAEARRGMKEREK